MTAPSGAGAGAGESASAVEALALGELLGDMPAPHCFLKRLPGVCSNTSAAPRLMRTTSCRPGGGSVENQVPWTMASLRGVQRRAGKLEPQAA